MFAVRPTMHKTTLVFIALSFSLNSFSQNDYFVFKKRKKTLRTYWQGSLISFQLSNKEWRQGYITKIQNDSFYIRPEYVRYLIGFIDTIRFNIESYAIKDIAAMPEKGLQIDYKNGRFQVRTNAGHIHFYWIKSGYLFRALGLGLAGLIVTNDLIKKRNIASKDNLKIAPLLVASYGFGKLLKLQYRHRLPIGKRFTIKYVKLS
jgi:hypothetical protein